MYMLSLSLICTERWCDGCVPLSVCLCVTWLIIEFDDDVGEKAHNRNCGWTSVVASSLVPRRLWWTKTRGLYLLFILLFNYPVISMNVRFRQFDDADGHCTFVNKPESSSLWHGHLIRMHAQLASAENHAELAYDLAPPPLDLLPGCFLLSSNESQTCNQAFIHSDHGFDLIFLSVTTLLRSACLTNWCASCSDLEQSFVKYQLAINGIYKRCAVQSNISS